MSGPAWVVLFAYHGAIGPVPPAAAILNHKYTGEIALRSSGLSYSIIRPTGLTNEGEGGPFLLEVHQG